MTPTIRALGTANPPLYTTQRDAFEFFRTHFNLDPEEEKLYRRLLLEGPIRGRYVGMDTTEDACETDPDRLNARFLKYARQTAAAAATKGLEAAHVSPHEIGGLVVNTCTGYLCPGLTSYLAEDLELRSDLRTLDIAGMGCGGALPNLQAATGLLALNGERPVLSIAVEMCSATLFMGTDPALVVSNSIFGDGAAAVVLQNGEGDMTDGNMSSPSVLFALKHIIEQGRPRSGDLGVLITFGAGFSAFAALVEFL